MAMKMTRNKITACIIFIITGLLCTSYSNGQIDPKSIEGVWLFDEASGNIAKDSSGHGYDAELKENPEWVEGKFGHALELQGGSYLEIRDSSVNLAFGGSEPFSITAWVKNQGGGTAVGKFNGGIIGAYILVINGDGTVTFHREVAPWTFSGSKTLPDDDFGHVAVTYDGFEMKIYINGQLDAQQDRGPQNSDTATPVLIGARFTNNEPSEFFNGVLDEIALFNVALTTEQIRDVMNGLTFLQAFNPDPANGALHEDTWVSLSWSPGDFAASHDVYFGENFDDVNTGTAETFLGNQNLAYFIVGFPGNPYPDGLVPGTTYYWRIDEVNDIHPDSPWVGDVWSFTIPSISAYYPVPADGARFLEPDLKLSWSAGFNSILHNVYFGDNVEDVNAGTGGTSKGPANTTSYIPGGLEPGKTYYWRIDEFDGAATHKGDIWSFTVAGTGGGLRADYYKGINFENFVLTRTDPQINFNWGDPGGPDPAVGDDNFSVRWTGEVEAAFTETYAFYPRTDDGVRLFVDGQLLVDRWVDRTVAENRAAIDLIAGNTYSLVMEYYENSGGAVAELSWSSPRTLKQLIPQAALALPVKAGSPNPRSGSVDVSQTTVLSWGPGDYATSHQVYFGTDEEAVRNATKASPEFKGTKALGDESYEPDKMDWDTTYYWRVDEINPSNPDSPWIGNVWSFTTADFLIIDDMESYDAGENQIWYSWHDGLGYGTPGVDPYFAGNGTGAAVGDENTPSFTAETIVHGGSQSMPLVYDNNKEGYSKYSEAELTLTAPRDWTEGDVANLTLWFRGLPGSVGSFAEAPTGTYTMNAAGTDIWAINGVEADEFHFAYKMLTGAGSIIARLDSVENTHPWAKAGVMIRESLNPDSAHALACITPANGVAFQYRPGTGNTSGNFNQTGITAPYWVKLERSISGNFTVSHSANGTTWSPIKGAAAQNIPMGSNVYIGLALTSHVPALTCQAVFSNVTTTGNVSGQWAHQDIGILSNDPEPLYVAVSNSTGNPADVVHDDPAAVNINSWTEWVIPLQAFAEQGINLTNVDRIAIGLGTKGNTTVPGGSGKIFIDDIRLYRTRDAAEE